jgi:two-component sensor histidine kinase
LDHRTLDEGLSPAAAPRRTPRPGADFKRLVDAIAALSEAHGAEDIIEIVRRSARGLSGARGVAVIFNDDGFCNYLVEDSESPLWAGQKFPAASCISGWAMIHNATVVIPDIFLDDRIPHDAYRPTFVRSLIMTPVGEERPFAAIGAYWAETGAPDPAEVAVMETLARSTATAFKNLQLYDSLSRQLEQRKKDAEHLRLMVNELNHRVKNTLATVQSVAMQTFRAATTVDEAKSGFDERLHALSRIHEMLTEASWESADLSEIAQRTLTVHAGADRFAVSGPEVTLSPKAASSVAMALNELATNAIKHGALSNPTGRVDLSWTVSDGARGPEFKLDWRESGGKAPAEPRRTGFGERLLTRGLPRELEGVASATYGPGGLNFTLSAPLASLEPHPADPSLAL